MTTTTYGVTKDGHIFKLLPFNDQYMFGNLTETLQPISMPDHQQTVAIKDIVLMTEDLEEAKKTRQKALVELYQCPGCTNGYNTQCSKFIKHADGIGCDSHSAGTFDGNLRPLFLGMPKGFNKIGPYVNKDHYRLYVYDNDTLCWQQNILQVPVWKHLDNYGNTIVRGYLPRINKPILFVVEGDVRDRFNCIEITGEELSIMD